MKDGEDLVEFLQDMRRECFFWGTFKNDRKLSMGAVKYVDAVFDSRDGRVFCVTLRGLVGDDKVFSETNEWRDSNCFQRAMDYCRVLHDFGHDAADNYIQRIQKQAEEDEMRSFHPLKEADQCQNQSK